MIPKPIPGVTCSDKAHPNHGHAHHAHHPKVHPTMGHSHAHHHAPQAFSPLAGIGRRRHGVIRPRLTPAGMEAKPIKALKAHKTRHVHHHRHHHKTLPPC